MEQYTIGTRIPQYAIGVDLSALVVSPECTLTLYVLCVRPTSDEIPVWRG